MKSSIVLFILSALVLVAQTIRADESTLASIQKERDAILKERDAILSELVKMQEVRHASGPATMADIDSARLVLWIFRRDTAKTNAEKIKQQELIVPIYERRLELVKAQRKVGVASLDSLLAATDELLQARQTLEELKLAANAQTPVPAPAFPKAVNAGKNQIDANSVAIVIQKDGTILFNGKKTAKDRLAQLLSETKAASRDAPVLVSADETVPIETITLIMDACRKAGFAKFSLQTR